MCSSVPAWNRPNTLLIRAIKNKDLSGAEEHLVAAIKYYRKNYIGADSGLARFELKEMQRQIKESPLSGAGWERIIASLEQAGRLFNSYR